MIVVAKRVLREFWEIYPESKMQLNAWYKEAQKGKWNSPHKIKSEYPTASIIKNNRVVFNICGNRYRLIVEINYIRLWVFVRFIGNHKRYDEIDPTTI